MFLMSTVVTMLLAFGAPTPSSSPECLEVALWKSGDDGLSNRLFANVEEAFGAYSRQSGGICRAYSVGLETNVDPVGIEDDDNTDRARYVFVIERGRGAPDGSGALGRIDGVCMVSDRLCGLSVFRRSMRLISADMRRNPA
jgi:hypothetical protein